MDNWNWQYGTSNGTDGVVWVDGFGGSSQTVTYRATYPDPEPNEPPSELDRLEKRVAAVCAKGRLA